MKPKSTDIGIVLIHGAGLRSWIWDDVKLAAPTLAINLPLRDQPKETRAQLTLDDYVQDALTRIQDWHSGKVVVIAHSLGGVIGLEVAHKLGHQLAGFVGVCAAIPETNQSFVSTLPFPQKFIMPIILKLAGTQPPASAIAAGLCNDTKPELTQRVIQDFSPESRAVYTDRVEYSPLTVPTLYVHTTKDKEYGTQLQTTMAKRLPQVTIVDVSSGHMPMLSQPDALSKVLNTFVQRLS